MYERRKKIICSMLFLLIITSVLIYGEHIQRRIKKPDGSIGEKIIYYSHNHESSGDDYNVLPNKINEVNIDRIHSEIISIKRDIDYISWAESTPILIEPKWYFPSNITIEGNVIYSDTALSYNDTVIIVKGNLTLINTTMILSSSSDGKSGIVVVSGGNLRLRNSTITYNESTGYRYFIYVEANATLYAFDSVIEYCGWNSSETGLIVGFNYSVLMVPANITLEKSVLRSCYTGINAIENSTLTIESCSFMNMTSLAIKTENSGLTINNSYSENTIFIDNSEYEINNLTMVNSGIEIYNSYGSINNSRFDAYMTSTDLTCIFTKNTNITISNIEINASARGSVTLYLIRCENSRVSIYGAKLYMDAFNGANIYGIYTRNLPEGILIDNSIFNIVCNQTNVDTYIGAVDMYQHDAYINNSYFNGSIYGKSLSIFVFSDKMGKVTIRNTTFESWTFGLSTVEQLWDGYNSGASKYYVKNCSFNLHAYEGTSWAVSIDFELGSSYSIENSTIFLDCYGYGGEKEYSSYYVMPILNWASTITMINCRISSLYRGFAFVILYLSYYGYDTIKDTSINISMYDSSYAYGYYSYGASISLKYSNASISAYGDSILSCFIYTRSGSSSYQITNTNVDSIGGKRFIIVKEQSHLTLDATRISGFDDAIFVDNSTVQIDRVQIVNNTAGIKLEYCKNPSIKNSILYNLEVDVDLYSCENAVVSSNQFLGPTHSGVIVDYSLYTTITNNSFQNSGVLIHGDDIIHYTTHNITTDNIIDGEPIYYIKNQPQYVLENAAVGELIIANTTTISLTNITVANTTVGIELAYCGNAILNKIYMEKIKYGIYIVNTEIAYITNSELAYHESGIVVSNSSLNVVNTLISNSSSGINCIMSTVNVNVSTLTECMYGISSYNSTLNVEYSEFYGNKYGLLIESSIAYLYSLKIENCTFAGTYAFRTILMAEWGDVSWNNYGFYIINSTCEIHYSNITNNYLHGVLVVNNTVPVNASYNWWGHPDGPNITADADVVDPEEIYGLFTQDTITRALDIPAGLILSTATVYSTITLIESTNTTITNTQTNTETMTTTIYSVRNTTIVSTIVSSLETMITTYMMASKAIYIALIAIGAIASVFIYTRKKG